MRRTVQMISIAAFFFLLYKTVFPLPEKYAVNLYFRGDAFLAAVSGLATMCLSGYFLPALLLSVAVIIFGNFFCFWLCPFGGCVDVAVSCTFRKKWRIHPAPPVFMRKIRAIILYAALLSSVAAHFIKTPSLAWMADPFVILTRGAVLKRTWGVVALALVAVSVVMPRFWCNNLCPLGALYSFLGFRGRHTIKKLAGRFHGAA